jgi:hypothetical protein
VTTVGWIALVLMALIMGFSIGESSGYEQAMWLFRDELKEKEDGA